MDRESLYQSRSHPVDIELRRFCGIVQVTWLSSECSTINPLPERNHALAVHDYLVQPRSDAAYSVGALGRIAALNQTAPARSFGDGGFLRFNPSTHKSYDPLH